MQMLQYYLYLLTDAICRQRHFCYPTYRSNHYLYQTYPHMEVILCVHLQAYLPDNPHSTMCLIQFYANDTRPFQDNSVYMYCRLAIFVEMPKNNFYVLADLSLK